MRLVGMNQHGVCHAGEAVGDALVFNATDAKPMNILATFVLALITSLGAEASVQFSPSAGVTVLVEIEGNVLSLKTSKGGTPTEQKFNFETEKALNLVVEDLNFDDLADFSASSIDEGKGAFEAHRVFIFDATNSGFKEIFPSCGDELLNLRVDRVTKILNSTYLHSGASDLPIKTLNSGEVRRKSSSFGLEQTRCTKPGHLARRPTWPKHHKAAC